jgi:glycosyltransferase involved in cell wall biosynthesis
VGSDLSVFHVIGDLEPRSGGTARAVVDVTDALAQEPGVSATLLYQTRPRQDCLESSPGVQRVEAMARSRWALNSGLPLKRALVRQIALAAPSLIHIHGLWLPLDHWAAAAARRHRIPLVIQPHGMLEPWALEHRAWKKRIAMRLFQRRDLDAADLLIASTAREAQSLRRAGFNRPVAVIPHGIRPVAQEPAARTDASGTSSRPRTVLFLSRLSPTKGLPLLINAWARLHPEGWRLVIAGPDEGGHLRDIQSLIRRLSLNETVQCVGEVRDEVKSALYRAADLFVLPTYTENFGLVVVEALAHGVPVITTRGAPWAELETHRCGWWIEIGEEPLVRALQDATAMNDEARREMGARGRAFAQRFEWAGIARQLHAAYGWVLGRGVRPECVQVD